MQVGGSIGIAISAVIHTFIYDRYLGQGYEIKVAEHFALQNSFLITAIIILLAVIPALKLPQRSKIAYLREKLKHRIDKKNINTLEV